MKGKNKPKQRRSENLNLDNTINSANSNYYLKLPIIIVMKLYILNLKINNSNDLNNKNNNNEDNSNNNIIKNELQRDPLGI